MIYLLPCNVLGCFAEGVLFEPVGCPGDYLTIELLYDDELQGNSALGLLLGRAHLDLDQAIAVGNRRSVMTNQILPVVRRSSKGDEPARIHSLARGPARAIFDVFDQSDSINLMNDTHSHRSSRPHIRAVKIISATFQSSV